MLRPKGKGLYFGMGSPSIWTACKWGLGANLRSQILFPETGQGLDEAPEGDADDRSFSGP